MPTTATTPVAFKATKKPMQTSAQPAPPTAPVQFEEPRAGGNYLRDPVTGALTPNPAFQETQE